MEAKSDIPGLNVHIVNLKKKTESRKIKNVTDLVVLKLTILVDFDQIWNDESNPEDSDFMWININLMNKTQEAYNFHDKN